MDLKVSRHCHQNLEFSTWKIRLEIHKAKMEKLVSCIYLKEKEKKPGARPTHNLALSVIQTSLVLQKK